MAIERLPGLIEVTKHTKIPAEKPKAKLPSPLVAVGTGAAGLVIGSAIGGVVGLALGGRSGGSAIGVATTLAGAVAGAGLGAGVPYVMASRRLAHDTALFGPTPLDAARQVLTRFDHNHNAQIDLHETTGVIGQDERLIVEYDYNSDRHAITRVTSATGLLKTADSDGDGIVSMREIESVLAPYDSNGNGHIDAHEQQAIRLEGLITRSQWVPR